MEWMQDQGRLPHLPPETASMPEPVSAQPTPGQGIIRIAFGGALRVVELRKKGKSAGAARRMYYEEVAKNACRTKSGEEDTSYGNFF